ncbi:MAG: hypothetical protein KJ587_08930 [Alphaproteobacteria bacterium]|nr:hypothetical protein [Alphaproteobacteria bacterium]
MKIKAVRVREVGRFEKPIAVEGFSGGLDVLAGPNELGKSTLFRALRLVLNVKHSSKSDAVGRLTPYSGGQPLIEADLELGGKAWRITKRFGRGPRAQLIDLESETILARNSEADEMLSELLQSEASGFGAHGLVWVGQKESLVAPQPDVRGERGALMAAIESEIGAMSGSGIADAVRARVAEQLGELVTTRGPRKGSRYAVALERQGEAQKQLEAERGALASVEGSQRELEELQVRFGQIGDATQLAALVSKAKAAQSAVEEAERQRLRVRQAKEAVQFCSNEQKTAQTALADFNVKAARLTELTAGIDQDDARLPELMQAADDAQAAYEKVRGDGERLREEERRLQVSRSRVELSAKLEEKSRVLEAAGRLDRVIAEDTERMRSDPVTGERIDRLQRLEHQHLLAEGRIAAESPTVQIVYEAGARQPILADGAALADGASMRVREMLVLEISGVGRIEIAAGDGEGRDELLVRSASLVAERDGLLGELGAGDVAEAQARYGERQKRDRRLASAIAELRGLAPDGTASLRSDVGDLENQLGRLEDAGNDDAGGLSVEEIGARLQQVSEQLDAARRAYPECAAAQKASAKCLAEVQAAAAARRQRIEELERLLGAPHERETQAAELEARGREADEKLADAVRKAAALEEVLPDDDALEALSRRAGESSLAVEAARLESGRLREAISAASARIEMAGDSGLGRRVAELEGELQRAAADVGEIEAEIDALNLLSDALDAARQNARDRLLAPLQERVGPYLSAVFGGARARFAEGFGLEGLERVGRGLEKIDMLSDGTQEQLGIVVRLAYARLIADCGEALPIILDDPLVYSDAERIGQMFAALQIAAVRHQVVVLTCREAAFAALGGIRLALSDWRPEHDF